MNNNISALTAQQLVYIVKHAAAVLETNKKVVNELNVFPIPDGDTGDNMYMTIAAARAKACEADPQASLAELSQAISQGALMGARGNSGVILSRIIKGMSNGMQNAAELNAYVLKNSLECAVAEAYASVSTPVEGTILTVMKDAAKAVIKSGERDLLKLAQIFCDEAHASVKRTPDLLEVLKEARVVDSGGAGLFYIADGCREALENLNNPDWKDTESSLAFESGAASGPETPDFNLFTEDSTLEFGYCTEFLLRLQRSKVNVDNFDENEIKDYLCSVGESVVCFKEGSIVKVHVHTKTPGEILTHCQKWGEYLKLKIENMTLQHNGTAQVKNNFAQVKAKYATVCVANGEGLTEMFRQAGADHVIYGGQTMNPSAETFIDAFDKLNAETIFVFPNNSNIIMTAAQAAEMYKDADVRVVKTKDIGQGYVTLASMDKTVDDPAQLQEMLDEIAAGVTTISVSKAIRDAEQNGISVKEGAYVGINGHDILCCSPDAPQAVMDALTGAGAANYDIAIIIKGADASQQDYNSLLGRIRSTFPRLEAIEADGGQAIYDYIAVLQ